MSQATQNAISEQLTSLYGSIAATKSYIAEKKYDLASTCFSLLLDKYEKLKLSVLQQEDVLNDQNEKLADLATDKDVLAGKIDLLKDSNEQLLTKNSQLTAENNSLSNTTHSLNERLERNERVRGTEVSRLKNEIIQLTNQLSNLQIELDHLKSLNPLATKRQLDLVEKKRNKDKSELTRLRKELEDTQKKYIQLQNDKQTVQPNVLDTLIQRNEIGEAIHEVKSFEGNVDKGMVYRVMYYDFPLVFSVEPNEGIRLYPVEKWHYQVLGTNGIAIQIAVSEFLSPICPVVPQLSENWPAGLNQFLHQEFYRRIYDEFPQYCEYIDLLKTTIFLANKSLTIADKKVLRQCKIETLFDICSLTYQMFGKQVKAVMKNKFSNVYSLNLYNLARSEAYKIRDNYLVSETDEQKEAVCSSEYVSGEVVC